MHWPRGLQLKWLGPAVFQLKTQEIKKNYILPGGNCSKFPKRFWELLEATFFPCQVASFPTVMAKFLFINESYSIYTVILNENTSITFEYKHK